MDCANFVCDKDASEWKYASFMDEEPSYSNCHKWIPAGTVPRICEKYNESLYLRCNNPDCQRAPTDPEIDPRYRAFVEDDQLIAPYGSAYDCGYEEPGSHRVRPGDICNVGRSVGKPYRCTGTLTDPIREGKYIEVTDVPSDTEDKPASAPGGATSREKGYVSFHSRDSLTSAPGGAASREKGYARVHSRDSLDSLTTQRGWCSTATVVPKTCASTCTGEEPLSFGQQNGYAKFVDIEDSLISSATKMENPTSNANVKGRRDGYGRLSPMSYDPLGLRRRLSAANPAW